MKRTILCMALGALIGAALMYLKDFKTESTEPIQSGIGLEQSFQEFATAIEQAGSFVQQHQWYGSPLEQAEAYRHILRGLISAIEVQAMSDRDFPYFHEVNPFSKSGMDNSDQRYLITMLNGEASYKAWGNRGTSRRLDFTLYEGSAPMAPSFATLTTEQLISDDEGNFELHIGGSPRANNWLPGHPGTIRLLVRQIHSNWSEETPGQMHIDRIDDDRPAYPVLTRGKMAEQLRNATNAFAEDLRRWPELSRTRFSMLMPKNRLMPPQDTGKEGGLAGRWMVGGHFDLTEDEALIISTRPTDAKYQGIQLGHHWWESLDYANRQSSLTADQAKVSSDGAIYFVISHKDPGVSNWLDTEGFSRGVILMRYDGMSSELNDEQTPVAEVVKMGNLREYLPADEPVVSAEQRARQIAERRRHVQLRFGL